MGFNISHFAGKKKQSYFNSLGILKVNPPKPFKTSSSRRLTPHHFKHMPASLTSRAMCFSDLRGTIWRPNKEGPLAKKPLLG